MSLEIKVTIPKRLTKMGMVIDSTIKEAHNAAVPEAAAAGLRTLRPMVPFGTGLLRRQTVIKYFRRRNGLLSAALKVLGKRKFVMHILEYGAKSHGGKGTKGKKVRPGTKGDRGPIAPRRTFEIARNAMQVPLMGVYRAAFSKHLNKILARDEAQKNVR